MILVAMGLTVLSLGQVSQASTVTTFVDDFSTYDTKEDIMAVYNITYTGGANQDSWTFDPENNCIIAELKAGDGIFWYLIGEVKGLNDEPGMVLVKGFGTGGDFTQLGVRVETEDDWFAHTTVWIPENLLRCDYGHGHVRLPMTEGYLWDKAIPALRSKGTTWEHWTVEYEDYWSVDIEHSFTMTNDHTNKVGFWAVSLFYPGTITIEAFEADIVLAER